jgi:hypothetical protein
MKQIIITMGLISGLLGLLGCDNKTSDKTNQTDTSKVETINPNDILFTTPTLENALPEFESKTDTSNLHFHEDDWRQIEFISKNQKNQIDSEILKIKDIYDKFSHKGDTYTAFKQVAIRESIKEPLTLSFSKLKSYLTGNSIKLKGVTLDGNTGQVKNGFSFKTGGVEFYGVVENDNVKTLCIYSADSEEQLKASFDKLSKLSKTENLYLVDWIKMKVLDENSIRTELLTDEK